MRAPTATGCSTSAAATSTSPAAAPRPASSPPASSPRHSCSRARRPGMTEGGRARPVPPRRVLAAYCLAEDASLGDKRLHLRRADARRLVVPPRHLEQAVIRGGLSLAGDVVEEHARGDAVQQIQPRIDVAAAVAG